MFSKLKRWLTRPPKIELDGLAPVARPDKPFPYLEAIKAGQKTIEPEELVPVDRLDKLPPRAGALKAGDIVSLRRIEGGPFSVRVALVFSQLSSTSLASKRQYVYRGAPVGAAEERNVQVTFEPRHVFGIESD